MSTDPKGDAPFRSNNFLPEEQVSRYRPARTRPERSDHDEECDNTIRTDTIFPRRASRPKRETSCLVFPSVVTLLETVRVRREDDVRVSTHA